VCLFVFFMRFGYGILGPWLEGKGSGDAKGSDLMRAQVLYCTTEYTVYWEASYYMNYTVFSSNI